MGSLFLSVEFMEGVSCRKTRDFPFCKVWKRYGYCRTMKKRLARYCPHECGYCGVFSVNIYLQQRYIDVLPPKLLRLHSSSQLKVIAGPGQ